MKVTPEMYGRPAKCVSCHRKWFVPEPEDIPDNIPSIFLKDHPDLLRKTGQFKRSVPFHDESAVDEGELYLATPLPEMMRESVDDSALAQHGASLSPGASPALPDISDDHDSMNAALLRGQGLVHLPEAEATIRPVAKIPLEELASLRLLCNARRTLENRLAVCASDDEAAFLAAMERALVNARTRLDKGLDDERAATERQLAAIEDEVSRTLIALRVGDISISQFVKEVNTLRARRETLIRCAHNLGAWGQVTDVDLAGGELEVDLDTFDAARLAINIPPPRIFSADTLPFVVYNDELRVALEQRSDLERRIAEWERLADENADMSQSAEVAIRENKARLGRVNALVRFNQQRLEQLLRDTENDIRATQTYAQEVESRARKGELRDSRRNEILAEIETVERDLSRTRNLIRRALSANSSSEMPTPSDTLIDRLQGKSGQAPFEGECILFLLSLVFWVAAFVGVVDATHFFMLWAFASGAILAVVQLALALFLVRAKRRLITSAVWLVVLSVSVATVRLLTDGGVSSTAPLLPAGALVAISMFFAGLGAGAAVSGTRSVDTRLRSIGAMLIFAFLSALLVCAAGVFPERSLREQPTRAEIPESPAVPAPPLADAVEDREELPEDASTGEKFVNSSDPDPVVNPDGVPAEADIGVVDNGGDDPETQSTNTVSGPLFTLIGVAHGEGVRPRFRGTLTFPDGEKRAINLRLGDTITGDWKAREYQVDSKRLIIANDQSVLVLQAGRTIDLESGEEVAVQTN